MALIETPPDAIVRSPWGRYASTGTGIVWCASRKLSGASLWGRPDADQTRVIMRLFDEYPRVMDPKFDMILDTRDVEAIDGEALEVLTGWMWDHRDVFDHGRITSVVREGPTGFLLAGLLPTIGNASRFRVTTDAPSAFHTILGESGIELSDEVELIVARLRGLPRELQLVRALLVRRLDATVDDAAKELGMSARSLQRSLANAGTSFHDEVVKARITLACELLLTTDLKVGAIATRLGISERAVTLLFRTKTGKSPIEWRNHNRHTA
ncbi:hypothetical protein BH09MYX1_BH09MYX1_03390 [soil metagenome]